MALSPTGGWEIEFLGTERFSVVRRLGEGGMGVVYEVRDAEQGTRVALKWLRKLSARGVLFFKNEFRALADVQHHNLVSLGELMEQDDRWFFTMELVEGMDFLSYVRPGEARANPDSSTSSMQGNFTPTTDRFRLARPVSGQLDLERLRAALRQLAEALRALHAAGKVHRDIKPSNIRITPEGRLVLLDFGLVLDVMKELDVDLAGTPDYMAPEQVIELAVGPAADWYSVGVLVYQALTGQLPFTGSTAGVLAAKRRYDAPRPAEMARGVPPDLDRLCAALLDRDPASRPNGEQVLLQLGIAPEAASRRSSSAAAYGLEPSPFVGRREELGLLEQALGEAAGGRAATVLIQGDSGVG
jgi:serine/threonine protein kinase